uniref:Stationary-phase survival protein (SurE) n=1 Tax=uncultured marine group II/III euryarchaeote SAT1000_36_D10 TaxID=1456578 RepID=A0A075I9R1_9EURY|nr:stationary-phase survival protein (surE) [uncultured marine group II/III euryarchaeote SAT1000_36_D10]
MSRAALFMTNDDGIESAGLHLLIAALHARGHPVVVLAPASEQSCSGMRLTLRHDLKFEERSDIADSLRMEGGPPLRIFSLDGSPCDCAIVALDGGLQAWAPEIKPSMCISGINQGPNLSVDVLHSGTVSAARETSLYGMPAIAISLATYEHSEFTQTVEASLAIIEACLSALPDEPLNLRRPEGSRKKPLSAGKMEARVRSAFAHGDMFLNINAPKSWNGLMQTTSLGSRWYHNAIDMNDRENIGVAYEVGAAIIEDEDIPGTDCNAINSGAVAITPLSSWPVNHPLGLSGDIMTAATEQGSSGLPSWLE